MSDSLVWTENRPRTKRIPFPDVRELVTHRELALFLALRDLQLRYKQTVFGVAWVILQPLLAAAIFTLLFGRLVRLSSDGLPYVVFAYCGLAIWLPFSQAVSQAAVSLVNNEALVTKIYFPRLLAPIAAVMPSLLDLAISLVVLGGFLVVYGIAPGWSIVLLPVWVALLVVFAAGVGALLAAVNVKYRDMKHVLPFALQIWLFSTPIIYASSLVEDSSGGGDVLTFLYSANPMVGLVDGFRWSLVNGPPPGLENLTSLATGIALVVAGIVYFQRWERRFADVI